MSDRQKELRFRVSEAELFQIQENAKTLGMQIHPFVRYVGTEYATIVEDRTCFYEHTDRVASINRFLHFLEYTIEASYIPRPKLLSDIYQIRDEVYYLTNQLYDRVRHHRTKLYRAAQKEAQKQIEQITASDIPKPNKLADKRPHSIRIKVSPQEEEKIQSLAALHHLPIGVYLRHIALHPHFVRVDYTQYIRYTSVTEQNLMRIFEVADKIYKRGYYNWYEIFFVLRAVILIAANEQQLILEMADRRPKLAALNEKYEDVLSRFKSLSAKYRWDVLHGTLTALPPEDIDWKYDDTPTRMEKETIAPIGDAYEVGIDNIIRNATERSGR